MRNSKRGFGSPEVLFSNANFFGRLQLREYDLSADGQRFLRLRTGAATTDANIVPEVILIQNWFDELQRLVPSP